MYGWAGTILRVDLTRGKVFKEPLSGELVANFIGGRGINVKILHGEVRPGNRLVFGTTNWNNFTEGGFNVTQKHPLTGILDDGNSGGH